MSTVTHMLFMDSCGNFAKLIDAILFIVTCYDTTDIKNI